MFLCSYAHRQADDRDQQRYSLMPCRLIRRTQMIALPASAVAPTNGEGLTRLPLLTYIQLLPPPTNSICPIAHRPIMCLFLCPPTPTPPRAITLQGSLTAVLLPRPTRALPMPSKANGLPRTASTTRLKASHPTTRTLARCSMLTTMVRPIPRSTILPGRQFSRMAIRAPTTHPFRSPASLKR